ncbi:hypothetical protein BDN71DRAFT_1592166 [Pleurotus eryngii]|uniref:Uncharacterized protein n=1 Tax=Pleurotus eryngii TaxID=5323 RepID=A0A9P5ZTT7_PLEER|nr:hypothetical protein BDN71DRAFT_1592166 [Pleurotus eryngii]
MDGQRVMHHALKRSMTTSFNGAHFLAFAINPPPLVVMAGDHQCSVCQATFTRPQHVARHMRSHTGDKPYKCEFCGDQFARSDLLSRHVNKSHASEKPIAGSSTTRKKAASRATTSRQSCDQCVESNLFCDGSNPCSKCTQRAVRCTFVKFHRKTAPIGPGHNLTRPQSTSSRLAGPSSSTDFLLGPALPSFASRSSDPTPISTYTPLCSLPNLRLADDVAQPGLPKPSEADYAKYQSQAEYIRRLSLFQSGMEVSPPTSTTPLGRGSDTSAASGLGVGATNFAYPSVSDESKYSTDPRSLSVNFSSDSSAPPSPTWSGVHLPPDVSSQQHPYHESHAHTHSNDLQDGLPVFPPNANFGHNDSEFSSALSLMSLEDPNALAEFSNDVASFFTMNAIDTFSDNFGSTPMPRKPSARGADLLTQSNTPRHPNGHSRSSDSQSPVSRDEELQALKDSWKMYLRTPDELTLPDFSTPASTSQSHHRTRVTSMPSAQPPSADRSGPLAAHGAPPSTRTAMRANPDDSDLRSYEAAVRARRAPLRLSPVPKRARGATIGSTITSSCSPLVAVATDGGGGAGSARPPFKRLASRTLGPEDAKRAMLGYDASDDDSDAADGEFERREVSYRCNLGEQEPSRPALRLGFGFSRAAMAPPASFGGLADRRRRMSVPAMRSTDSTVNIRLHLLTGALVMRTYFLMGQSCILAVGSTQATLVPAPEEERGFKTAQIMKVTLSSDHRTVDGAVAARWMAAFKGYLENPLTFML